MSLILSLHRHQLVDVGFSWRQRSPIHLLKTRVLSQVKLQKLPHKLRVTLYVNATRAWQFTTRTTFGSIQSIWIANSLHLSDTVDGSEIQLTTWDGKKQKNNGMNYL